MYIRNIEVVLLLIKIFPILSHASARKLLQGNLIWRHGDRSTGRTYPNDPYKGFWKNGLYQLTERGMSQAYDLGIFLRGKYGHLLSDSYHATEIYVKTTDTDRTKMTAQCVMAGLYSPQKYSTWQSKTTPWIPFPLHSTDTSHDWLIQVQRDPEQNCPKCDILLADIQKSSKGYAMTMKTYSSFFEELRKLTGTDTPYNLYSILDIFDNLNCLREHDHLLPDWVDDSIMKTLDDLAGISMGLRFVDIDGAFSKTLSKMRNGIILEKMIGNMKRRISHETEFSLVGYSAHDSTVTPLLLSLGAYNWILPPYASCVMIDLYENADNDYAVEFWFRNDSTKHPYPLSFYDCGQKCSFEKFLEVASSVITDDRTPILCGILETPNTDYRYFVYFLCGSLLLYLLISRRRHYLRNW